MHAACINRVIGRWRVITSVRSTRIAWKRSRDIARTLNNIRVRVIVFVRQETKFQWYVVASLLYFRCNVHERNLPLRLQNGTIPLSLRFFFPSDKDKGDFYASCLSSEFYFINAARLYSHEEEPNRILRRCGIFVKRGIKLIEQLRKLSAVSFLRYRSMFRY